MLRWGLLLIVPAWEDTTLRIIDFLVIVLLSSFWYGLVPLAGAFFIRRSWRAFRRYFNELRCAPLLDYTQYTATGNGQQLYRFIGNFESVTDAQTLWVQNPALTVPINLKKARIYLLPGEDGSELEIPYNSEGNTPERIRWNKLAALSDGAKVFVGGCLAEKGSFREFSSNKDIPLMVIIYDGDDRTLVPRAIQAGRQKNEYWNPLTPFTLALGIFCQLVLVLHYYTRTVYQLSAVCALVSVFTPLIPFIPPGVLFTSLYRRAWQHSREFRAYRDLVRLPLRYPEPESLGYGKESYGFIEIEEPIPEELQRMILAPPPGGNYQHIVRWRLYGILMEKCKERTIPGPSHDPMIIYGMVPGDPEKLSVSYALAARRMEYISLGLFLLAMVANLIFIAAVMVALLRYV